MLDVNSHQYGVGIMVEVRDKRLTLFSGWERGMHTGRVDFGVWHLESQNWQRDRGAHGDDMRRYIVHLQRRIRVRRNVDCGREIMYLGIQRVCAKMMQSEVCGRELHIDGVESEMSIGQFDMSQLDMQIEWLGSSVLRSKGIDEELVVIVP